MENANIVIFGNFSKAWSLRSNSATRHVLKWTIMPKCSISVVFRKIEACYQTCQSWKLVENETFWVIFKQCVVGTYEEGLARTADGRVACLKCFQTFSNMSNGERHYKSKHLTMAPVQCRICQRTFKNIYSHNEHLRQSHGLSQTMLKSRVVPKCASSNSNVEPQN